jgi:hypothetical protein
MSTAAKDEQQDLLLVLNGVISAFLAFAFM